MYILRVNNIWRTSYLVQCPMASMFLFIFCSSRKCIFDKGPRSNTGLFIWKSTRDLQPLKGFINSEQNNATVDSIFEGISCCLFQSGMWSFPTELGVFLWNRWIFGCKSGGNVPRKQRARTYEKLFGGYWLP